MNARSVFVTCERCSRRQQFDIVTNSNRALNAALMAVGWSDREDGEYCPDCVRSES